MFWSKTKDVVHDYNQKTSCFVTMENTLLGSVLDNLNWCGEEGSNGKTKNFMISQTTGLLVTCVTQQDAAVR